MHQFYCLISRTTSFANLSKAGYLHALEGWLCPTGTHPRPDPEKLDVHLYEDFFGSSPINYVYGKRLGLVKKKVLRSLGAGIVDKYLLIGDVYSVTGAILTDWCSYLGKNQCLLRGTAPAQYSVCDECGYIEYYCRNDWKFFWPNSPQVVELLDCMGFLVMTQEVLEKIPASLVRQLRATELEASAQAPDGLVELQSFPIQLGLRHRNLKSL